MSKRGPYKNRRPASERFDALWTPEPTSGCWLWLGALNNRGYGVFARSAYGHAGQVTYAHRFSLARQLGELPEGACALHTCDNRACVNPDHLYPGSKKDNTADMLRRGRARGWPRGLPTWRDGKKLTLSEARHG